MEPAIIAPKFQPNVPVFQNLRHDRILLVAIDSSPARGRQKVSTIRNAVAVVKPLHARMWDDPASEEEQRQHKLWGELAPTSESAEKQKGQR